MEHNFFGRDNIRNMIELKVMENPTIERDIVIKLNLRENIRSEFEKKPYLFREGNRFPLGYARFTENHTTKNERVLTFHYMPLKNNYKNERK